MLKIARPLQLFCSPFAVLLTLCSFAHPLQLVILKIILTDKRWLFLKNGFLLKSKEEL
jgi:hypothetical protein